MSRRVQTGCPNCKRCTNTALGEGGRRAGRATAALLTSGLSEGARLATGNCRACGHKVSLHHSYQASLAPEPAPTALPAVCPASLTVGLSPIESVEQKVAHIQSLAEAAREQLAGRSAMPSKAHRSIFANEKLAPSLQARAQRKFQQGRSLSAEANLLQRMYSQVISTAQGLGIDTSLPSNEPDVLEEPHGSFSPANGDLVSQLERLNQLRGEGVLSEEEFTSAKARLLES